MFAARTDRLVERGIREVVDALVVAADHPRCEPAKYKIQRGRIGQCSDQQMPPVFPFSLG